jgi:hypothetical protein
VDLIRWARTIPCNIILPSVPSIMQWICFDQRILLIKMYCFEKTGWCNVERTARDYMITTYQAIPFPLWFFIVRLLSFGLFNL